MVAWSPIHLIYIRLNIFICPQRKKIEVEVNIENVRSIGICFYSNCIDMTNFYTLEVVDRGSDPQLQVGKKLNNFIMQRLGG